MASTTATAAPSSQRTVEGRITKKRKRHEVMVLTVKEDEQRETKVVVSNKDHPSSLSFCIVDACIRVEGSLVVPDPDDEHQQDTLIPGSGSNDRVLAEIIELVHCAPTPQAIEYVMEGILEGGLFPAWTLPLSLDEIKEISQYELRQRRLAIAKVVRKIKGEATVERDPRQRKPHTKRSDLELLDRIEAQQLSTIRPITQMATTSGNTNDGSSFSVSTALLNVPDRAEQRNVVSRGRTRMEYIMGKKQPQVQWMTRRVAALARKPRHIVDVGGGRGDLAVGMAQELSNNAGGTTTMITVVDKNESSLLAGKEHTLKVMGGDDNGSPKAAFKQRINFVHADFYDFTEHPETYLSASSGNSNIEGNSELQPPMPPPIDLIVALHACGDLSDLAMAFATRLNIPFVVCPCCYTKRYLHEQHQYQPKWWWSSSSSSNNNWTEEEFQIMARLAELNERPHVSKRAVQIINSMRLNSLDEASKAHKGNKDQPWSLYLEEYESKSSLRNVVLIRDR
jgi:hypothetical protein